MAAYPRDMVGYGRTPPHAQWPGDARIAVSIVLNYEEGGENNVLHGDPASETFLNEIVGAAAYEMRHMSVESFRVRQPRGLLAAHASVRAVQRSGDGVGRGDGVAAQCRSRSRRCSRRSTRSRATA